MMIARRFLVVLFFLNLVFGSLFFADETFISQFSDESDSDFYNSVSEFLGSGFDDSFLVNSERLGVFYTRVLLPFVSFPIGYFFGWNVGYSVVNVFVNFASCVILWFVAFELFKRRDVADVSSLLFVGSQPLIVYGTRPMTDAFAYFFFVLVIFLWLRLKFDCLRDFLVLGGVLGLSFLNKETTFYAVLVFFAGVLFDRRFGFFEKVVCWLKFFGSVLVGLVPAFVWQFFVGSFWLENRGNFARNFDFFWQKAVANFFFLVLSRVVIAYNFLFYFFCEGVFRIWRKKDFDLLLKLFVICVPAGCLILSTYFFAPPFTPRFVFFSFYVVIPVAAFRLCEESKVSRNVLIGFYFVMSLVLSFMFPDRVLPTDQNFDLIGLGLSNLKLYFGF